MKVTRLVCGKCGSDLEGLSNDLVFVCSNCGSGWTGESSTLEPVNVEHLTSGGEGLHLPFWRVRCSVHVLKRKVRNEFTTTILRYGSSFDETEMPGKVRDSATGSDRREFMFPAFPVKGLPGVGVSLSENLDRLPPPLKEGEDYPSVCGASISTADAEVLARCVAVGQETARADWLAEIELVISSAEVCLCVLPCSVEVEKVRVAETGVSFFRRSVPSWNAIADHYSGEA